MTEIETKLEALVKTQKQTPIVAFSVQMQIPSKQKPPQSVFFSHTMLNVGEAFNGTHFRAPVSGLYIFSLSAVQHKNNHGVEVDVIINSSSLKAWAWVQKSTSGSISIPLTLSHGDLVWVKCHEELKAYDTFFSGHLVTIA